MSKNGYEKKLDRRRREKLAAEAEKTRTRKRKRFFAGVALAGTLAASAVFGLYKYADRYYQRELDTRYAAYEDMLKGTGRTVHSKPEFGFWDKLRHIRKIESMESSIGGVDAKNFADGNMTYIENLTRSVYEHYGYVDRQFKLREIESHKGEAIKYISEVLKGDFSNTERLIDLLNSNWAGIGLSSPKEAVGIMLAVQAVRGRSSYDALPENEKKNFGFTAYSDDGKVVNQKIENYEKLYSECRNLLKSSIEPITGFIGGTVPVTMEMVRDSDAVARWHTHPVNDPNYFPSEPDIANTYLGGPNFLFSQNGGILHIYKLNRGKSEEIYTSRIIK